MSDPPKPSPLPRLVLAGLAGLALGLVTARGYGGRYAVRPTDHTPAAVRHRVDLNAAGRDELMQVPGVGPARADAILTHRVNHGGFAGVDASDDVQGVGPKTVDKLRPWVSASGPPAGVERLERKPRPAAESGPKPGKVSAGETVDVNAADEAELRRLPGVGPTLARRIVDARAVSRFGSVDDLRRVKGIGPKTVAALRPYVVCR